MHALKDVKVGNQLLRCKLSSVYPDRSMGALHQWIGLGGLLGILLLMLMPNQVEASHIVGGQVSYHCINACTVRVETHRYKPCYCTYGIVYDASWRVATPGCPAPQSITPMTIINTEITPTCPNTSTACMVPGAAVNGTEKWLILRDYDICVGQACVYDLAWQECCRHAQGQTISLPNSTGIYIHGGTLDNTWSNCNSTPRFLDGPIRYLESGQDHDLSLHAYDADGDSLAYTLSTCLSDSVTSVSYLPGYNGLQPLGPSWNVSIDAETGILHLDANPGNAVYALICVTVSEYRNGQFLSSSTMDFDIEISNTINNAPTISPISNVTGVSSMTGDDLYLCAAGPLCFDITGADIDAFQNLALFWDMDLPGATFVSTANMSIHDTVTGTSALPPSGRFCWTPTANGTYQVKFRIRDAGCPFNWHADRVVTIHVGPTAGLSTATADLGACPLNSLTANFTASGCGAGPFTYTWSGAGGLSGNTQSLTHSYAGPGSYPWQVIVSDGGLVQDTIRDTIVVLGQTPFASLITGNIGLDSCAGIFTNTLGAGAYVGYSWSNGATAPLITATSPGSYGVTVQDPTGCYTQDTATVGWNPVDIHGIVHTSLGTMLQNQKIYLIRRDTALQALYAIDSTTTDVFGYYQFCNVTDTIVLIKAAPDSLAYPNEMPTYASATLFSNSAVNFYPLVQVPFTYNFSTLFGSNPGGPGFIGGLISQGANKVGAIGDPVVGLRVMLIDHASHAILGYTFTDVNGRFAFAGTPISSYDIVPDRPLVSTTNTPLVTLSAQQPVQDSLNFQLHHDWLELLNPTVGAANPIPGLQFMASPNPFTKTTRMTLHLPADAEVLLDVYDALGKSVAHLSHGTLAAQQYEFQVGEGLGAGVYFVQLKVNEHLQVLKVLKY